MHFAGYRPKSAHSLPHFAFTVVLAGGFCRRIGPRIGWGSRPKKRASGRSTILVRRGELRVNGPSRLDATSWSPVSSLVGDDADSVVKPRRGPSLAFAVMVIGGVALATAGAVSVFFVEPSEGAPDEQPVIAAEAPVETASLDPTFLPVRKVAVQHIKVKQPERPPAAMEVAVDADALAPLDPRWARATMPPPELAASVAATIPPAGAGHGAAAGYADPTDGTATAAIAPDGATPPRAAKTGATAADDPMSLVTRARPAQIRTAANMRSRPKSGSSIVMVVPKSATVQLVGCKSWCEIVYKGRRGYVYKDFLGGSRTASATAKPRASDISKPKAFDTSKPKAVKTVDTGEAALPGVQTQTIKPLSTRLQSPARCRWRPAPARQWRMAVQA